MCALWKEQSSPWKGSCCDLPCKNRTHSTVNNAGGSKPVVICIFASSPTFHTIKHWRKKQVNKPICKLAQARVNSVYLEGTISHNEGRASTPACYLLL